LLRRAAAKPLSLRRYSARSSAFIYPAPCIGGCPPRLVGCAYSRCLGTSGAHSDGPPRQVSTISRLSIASAPTYSSPSQVRIRLVSSLRPTCGALSRGGCIVSAEKTAPPFRKVLAWLERFVSRSARAPSPSRWRSRPPCLRLSRPRRHWRSLGPTHKPTSARCAQAAFESKDRRPSIERSTTSPRNSRAPGIWSQSKTSSCPRAS
jgi:hypothetical protein